MQASNRIPWKPLAVAFGVFAVSFSFALYTNHAWEDWYITYRASKNLAMGNGLVYAIGERVHSFTSPLGTLVPALFCALLGGRSDDLVLWLYRIFSCGLLAGTALILLRRAKNTGMYILPTAVLTGLFASDAKIIDFSINGQETALMMFFLACALYVLSVPVKYPDLKLGLAWGGLMWTRPDSFVYILGIGLGFLLFAPKTPNSQDRKELLKNFGRAGMLALAVYLPWLFWAWAYYGTPVPHTVVAKGLFSNRLDLSPLAKFAVFPFKAIFDSNSVTDTFMPSYSFLGGWPGEMNGYCRVVALLCAFFWVVPRANPTGRAISFACFLAHFYLSAIVPGRSPWYMPNVAFLSIMVLGSIFQQAWSVITLNEGKRRGRLFSLFAKPVVISMGLWLLAMSSMMTVATGFQVKVQQDVIENGNRKQIGLWLKENAAHPTETVFLECLGYIGFYSQLKMLDFPGLSSPEVVSARRKLGPSNWGDYAALIRELRPDWLVLRPFEVGNIEYKDPQLLKGYELAKKFDVSEKIRSYTRIPGRPYLELDQTFVVFRKNAPVDPRGGRGPTGKNP